MRFPVALKIAFATAATEGMMLDSPMGFRAKRPVLVFGLDEQHTDVRRVQMRHHARAIIAGVQWHAVRWIVQQFFVQRHADAHCVRRPSPGCAR